MKITIDQIEELVKHEQYYRFPGTTVTVCCLTLENGFAVIGESACIDPMMFNELIGQQEARKKAIDKIWELEGYVVKEMMYHAIENQ